MQPSGANLETSPQKSQTNSTSDKSQDKTNKSNTANNVSADKGNEPAKPKSLAEMFGDSSDETSTEIALGDDTPDDPSKPVDSIERLMKRHGLTAEQAYAIKVPMPNGEEALSIGEIKDRVGELVDFESRVTTFEERRIKSEGMLLQAQSELRDILEMLPKDALKPEVREKLRARQQATTAREKQLTLEHIPEWHDSKRRTADLEGMATMMERDYGFHPEFLATVSDHRAMKFIRDTYLIRSRIQKSLDAVRDPTGKKGQRPSAKSAKPAAKPGTNQPRKKASEVNRLLDYFSSTEK